MNDDENDDELDLFDRANATVVSNLDTSYVVGPGFQQCYEFPISRCPFVTNEGHEELYAYYLTQLPFKSCLYGFTTLLILLLLFRSFYRGVRGASAMKDLDEED